MRKVLLVLIGVVICLGYVYSLSGADPINVKQGVAIRGYDSVAFFEQGKPVRGSDQFTFEWMGARWHFASQENRDRFAENPERYAPQFGGYCAWAASQGILYDADPEFWRIEDDKLYLNYNADAQSEWVKDLKGNIQKGHQNWPGILKK